jgi:hypothetical protein
MAAPDGIHLEIDALLYGGWGNLVMKAAYKYEHEPLFVSSDAVCLEHGDASNDRKFEELDILVPSSLSSDFISIGSVPALCCISAYVLTSNTLRGAALKAPAVVRRRSASPASSGPCRQSSKAASTRMGKRKFPTEDTDGAWKGVWQHFMDCIAHDEEDTLMTLSEMRPFVKKYVSVVEGLGARPTSLAPFKKILENDAYKDLKTAAFENEGQKSEQDLLVQLLDATRGDNETKRRRSQLVDDADEDALSEILEDALSQGPVVGGSGKGPRRGGKDKVLPAQVISQVNTNTTALSALQKHLDERMNSLVARVETLEQEKLASKRTSALEGQTAQAESMGCIGLLGGALAQQRIILDSVAGDNKKMLGSLSDATFDSIINTVDNIYKWNNEQKRAFYGALVAIDKFKTEFDKTAPAGPLAANLSGF